MNIIKSIKQFICVHDYKFIGTMVIYTKNKKIIVKESKCSKCNKNKTIIMKEN